LVKTLTIALKKINVYLCCFSIENRGCASEISEETKLGVALIGVAILGSFLNARSGD